MFVEKKSQTQQRVNGTKKKKIKFMFFDACKRYPADRSLAEIYFLRRDFA